MDEPLPLPEPSESRPAVTVAAQPPALPASRRRSLRQKLRWPLLILGPLLVIGISGWFWITGGRWVETDNAYVRAHKTIVAAEVAGRVTEVEVAENQRVERGDLLFRIDDRSYRFALDKAQAQLDRVQREIQALAVDYRGKQQEVARGEADLGFADREFTRQRDLASKNVASAAKLDEAEHNHDAANRSLAMLRAQLARIVAELDGDPAIEPARHSRYLEAKAVRDMAALDLERTRVLSPVAGIVNGADRFRPGDHVDVGDTSVAVVADDAMWIEANFKETDLTWVRKGQEVLVSVDTFPGVELRGVVDGISPATGAEFSLLPPQNATGNWVKVVQRVPVRVILTDPESKAILRAGLSAIVEIDTRHRRELPSIVSQALAWVGREP